MWVVLTLTGILYVLWYARRIKRDPKRSVMYELDDVWRKMVLQRETKTAYTTPVSAWVVYIVLFAVMVVFAVLYPVSTISFGQAKLTIPALPVIAGLFLISAYVALRKSVHFFILDIFIFTILFLLVGVMGYHWYVMEIATLFFVMGLSSGAAMGYSPNKITELFIAGVKDILSAALVVGLAGGIIVVLQNGKVIDAMLHGIAESMSDVGKFGSLSIMYGIQTLINLVMTSGSAKAALTMPIMAPFSDLIEVSRQATVVAYQLGDGITNMITPTSAVLVGVLGVAKIPYEKWFRWAWPLILFLMILGLLLLLPTATLDLNGF